ncbi:hypothetical protein JDV02_000079 [Purpureocillium takamizusanense]|uniref:F-box domain-containing protein n=1 Tax=Purpureocillium takamizusanense TaxID=2060973 RepID=A0A9Q8V608_9HYPO|nr:uncharacterized protein JDV02_000079 [Purpureocillium takamizusanense]UNI13322.1 hypothetical protein JDV02_000079 [Purpureocillium takamizusanense]
MSATLEKLPTAALLKITGYLHGPLDILALACVNKTMHERVTTRAQQILGPIIARNIFAINIHVLLRVAYATTLFRDCLPKLSEFALPAPIQIHDFAVLACAAHLAGHTTKLVIKKGMELVFNQSLCPFTPVLSYTTAAYATWLNKGICIQRCALIDYAARIWLSKQMAAPDSPRFAWRDFLLDLYPAETVNNGLWCEHWCSLVQDAYMPEGQWRQLVTRAIQARL